jgi:hypothetical protein
VAVVVVVEPDLVLQHFEVAVLVVAVELGQDNYF